MRLQCRAERWLSARPGTGRRVALCQGCQLRMRCGGHRARWRWAGVIAGARTACLRTPAPSSHALFIPAGDGASSSWHRRCARPVAISPDGRRIAFVLAPTGKAQLYVQSLDALKANACPALKALLALLSRIAALGFFHTASSGASTRRRSRHRGLRGSRAARCFWVPMASSFSRPKPPPAYSRFSFRGPNPFSVTTTTLDSTLIAGPSSCPMASTSSTMPLA